MIMANMQIKCLRCGQDMIHIMTQKLQLGQTSWFLGDLPNLLAGSLEVDIYSCPDCGKLEFFSSDNITEDISENNIAQTRCPKCGNIHDIDYPKCPFCKYDYNK